MENLTTEKSSLPSVKKYVLKKQDTKAQYKINYEKELNPAQLEAVKSKDGSILVIAGAGSGKTKTLTYRVARLIESGVKPENILLLTFTKKAADEMLNRAVMILDSRCEKVAGGTFHSFSNMILRKYSNCLELKNNFTIIDRADAEDVINHIRGKVVEKQEKRFPRKGTILDIYSKAVNKNMSAESVIESEYNQFSHCVEKINEISQEYIAYKRQNSLLDYDDLLLYLKTLLTSNEEIRKKLSNQYKYILIDEYQDTNSLQAEIIRLLACEHNNVMAVGDDSQSIYSFRGANFRNILDFPHIFPDTKIIKLEQNYRSSQNILSLTNKVIEKAKEKYTKTLFSDIVSSEVPALICTNDMQTEAEFVAQRILELQEDDISLNDMAVLCRSARMTYNLEIELAKRAIPYKKFGGLKFIETAHVKDVIAHLRVVLNPNDIISLNRILLLLNGVGSQTAMRLLPMVAKENVDTEKLMLPAKSSDSIKKLFNTVDTQRKYLLKPSTVVDNILSYYEPILMDKYDDYAKRLKDLEHFHYLSEQYSSLEDFLSDLALEPPDSSVSEVEDGAQKDEYLTLSTIHSAKGLEWKAVFIIGAVDGRFPSVYSFNSEEELDEELRLMYVAATRAKTYLYITYPIDMFDYSTNMVLSKPSRFLDGIDSDILERWALELEE
ncbi:MAG: ATP-dependent helicase [Clostridium sp.]|nr:ATP-dependent helicase [Clostridium sp.]